MEDKEVPLVDGVFEGVLGALGLEMESLVDTMEVYELIMDEEDDEVVLVVIELGDGGFEEQYSIDDVGNLECVVKWDGRRSALVDGVFEYMAMVDYGGYRDEEDGEWRYAFREFIGKNGLRKWNEFELV
ncbi:hypothetical protein Tco_0603374 [Tanacetum coccineum]